MSCSGHVAANFGQDIIMTLWQRALPIFEQAENMLKKNCLPSQQAHETVSTHGSFQALFVISVRPEVN